MKNKILIFIISILFCSYCQGQNKDTISFYKEMPHYSSQGVVWQRDTIVYYKIFSEVELYKSSFNDYPYMYKYEDKNKEKHYFFIRQQDIKISNKKIEIKMYDDSDLELSIFKITNNLIFSFRLN